MEANLAKDRPCTRPNVHLFVRVCPTNLLYTHASKKNDAVAALLKRERCEKYFNFLVFIIAAVRVHNSTIPWQKLFNYSVGSLPIFGVTAATAPITPTRRTVRQRWFIGDEFRKFINRKVKQTLNLPAIYPLPRNVLT